MLRRNDDPVRDPDNYDRELILRAMWLEQFSVHYQPIIDFSTGALAGMEALIRWDHPDRGVVAASKFVPVAEREGLILPLGRDVMRAASAFRRDLEPADAAGLRVTLNLSEPELMHVDIVETVRHILEDAGLSPELVEVEVSVATLMQGREEAARTLAQLHEIGVTVSVDDFARLEDERSQLRELPVDSVKLDVTAGDGLNGSEQLERSVSVADRMGVGITAKRVESVAHFELLRSLGITRAQGYILGRPVSEGQFESLLLADTGTGETFADRSQAMSAAQKAAESTVEGVNEATSNGSAPEPQRIDERRLRPGDAAPSAS